MACAGRSTFPKASTLRGMADLPTRTKAFAPRVGVAYQATPKTVVRLGYGRSFDMGVFGSNFGHAVTQNLPVLVNQQVNANNNGFPSVNNAFYGAFTLAQGPPAFTFPPMPANGVLPLGGIG